MGHFAAVKGNDEHLCVLVQNELQDIVNDKKCIRVYN